MLAVDPPLSGEKLLSAVTESMVALHERYHHRTPVSAKTRMLGDDLLACVLGGVYTDVEQTMIELERATVVQENPQRLSERHATPVHRRRGAPIRPRRTHFHLYPSRRS